MPTHPVQQPGKSPILYPFSTVLLLQWPQSISYYCEHLLFIDKHQNASSFPRIAIFILIRCIEFMSSSDILFMLKEPVRASLLSSHKPVRRLLFSPYTSVRGRWFLPTRKDGVHTRGYPNPATSNMATTSKIHLTPAHSGIFHTTTTINAESAARASACLQENHEKHHVFFNRAGFHNTSCIISSPYLRWGPHRTRYSCITRKTSRISGLDEVSIRLS